MKSDTNILDLLTSGYKFLYAGLICSLCSWHTPLCSWHVCGMFLACEWHVVSMFVCVQVQNMMSDCWKSWSGHCASGHWNLWTGQLATHID